MRYQSVDSMIFSGVITGIVSSFGLGCLLIQVATYLFNLGNRETRLERGTVGVLFIITLGRTVCDCSGPVRGLLGRLQDDSYVVDPKVLMESTISPLLGVIIIGICHIFIANRILSFASSVKTSRTTLRLFLQWVVGGGVLICCLLGIATIVLIWTREVFVNPDQSIAARLASMRAYTTLSAVYSFFCVFIDVLLAAVVAFEVRKSKSHNNTNADRVLRSLLLNSVCSAILTGICQILKSIFLFFGFAAWAGTCFSITSTIYVVVLLLSISLPRSVASTILSPPPQNDVSSTNDFFTSSSSNDNISHNVLSSDNRNDSDEKTMSWDVERIGSRGKLGLGEMLASNPDPSPSNHPSFINLQRSSSSQPSSPKPTRPKSKGRSRSYYTSPPTSTTMLEEPSATYSPTCSRQSSLVRSTIGRGESRRRKKDGDLELSDGRNGGDIEEGGGGEGVSGLNLTYILSGLPVHSIIPSQSSRSSSRRL